MHERLLRIAMTGPFTQRLLGAGIGLTLLFTVMAPESSQPLRFLPRLAFWALHIGLGLGAAEIAARVILRVAPSLRDWRLVVLSGLVGATIFAPIAIGLEAFFPLSDPGPDEDWADRIAQSSPVAAILIEMLEMAPSYLAAWALINLEPIRDAFGQRRDGANKSPSSLSRAPAQDNGLLNRLPPAVGRDVVRVSSDLHYLRVVTLKGEAVILGALKEVESCFGSKGLRVHRSHWVLLETVVRLRKSGGGWLLELTNGDRVPVSRRKRADVIEQLGEDFVRNAA